MDNRGRTDQDIDFKLLFESSPSPMLILDAGFNIIAVTDSYTEATLTRREDILHKYIFDVFTDDPDNPDADGVVNLKASLERVIETGRADTMAIQRYDLQRPEEDGGGFEVRYWSPLNVPVLHADGTVRYIIHRVKDATEFVKLKEEHKIATDQMKRTEDMEVEIYDRAMELQQAREILELKNAELTRAHEEMESFSYSVSHDLRAPLRAVSGYAAILEEDYTEALDSEGRRLLREVQLHSQRMGQLIDDLLSFSRLGRKEVRKMEVDMNQLLGDVIAEIRRDKEIFAQIDIAPLHHVHADPALLRLVLVNLISNAIKYSALVPAPRISVQSSAREGEVVFSVRDNGVGFDMAYVHKLFGVFQRLHSSAQFEGTGVGLAIVRRVVERHGGRAWAEGQVNGGACFYFCLPDSNDKT
jgi:signal transduction histidine kinase